MMGKQNIAIRSHQDEDSSFMAMLSLLAKENSVLRDHLENAPLISKYTCPDIQNDIIFFSAKQILDGIIDNCKRFVIYALIADESTDVTNKEQISICKRFASILKWDFIITLVVLQYIFAYTNKLSVYL